MHIPDMYIVHNTDFAFHKKEKKILCYFKYSMKMMIVQTALGIELENQKKGPWALTLCLRTNLAMGQGSKSCTYTLFLAQGG